MNPIETPTESLQRNRDIRCSAQVSQSTLAIRDQIIPTSMFTDKAMIKYVIGVTNNPEQQSILKKSATNQLSTIKAAIGRPLVDASTVKAQATAQGGECKSQTTGKSLIKLPTTKNSQGLSEKSSPANIIRRSLPTGQQLKPRPVGMSTTAHGHIIYKSAKNGHSSAAYTEMISSSLKPRSSDLSSRKLPTIKDAQVPITKRLEITPVHNIIRSRNNSESSPTEVTQISSTVTLTKAATVTTTKQTNKLQSPLVTIEKKVPSLFNCSKQGKITFPNSAEPMDIVVNTIGGSKMISLGNDTDTELLPESGQKSLLLKQPSPNRNERTPPKLQSPKPKQQSLLKVNSLARLLHTSPRTKRSKSLTLGNTTKQRKRMPVKGRRQSTASDGEVSLHKNNAEKLSNDPLEIQEIEEESPTTVQTPSASLLCDENIETLPTSSNSSLEVASKAELKKSADTAAINSFKLNTVLEMLSAFNMLKWKDRIGSCKDSKIKFHLNEFNLLQIAEKCPPRDRIHTAYEKPIYERESSSNTSDYSDPLYLCRRCNCHGAAIDFLAPDFCSYECFRRDSRKRAKVTIATREKMVRERAKKARKSLVSDANTEVVGRVNLDVAIERLVPKRFFTWASYLSSNNATPAPVDLFLNPFPCGANLFEIGMKLEAIDPEHNSLFCVCTVVEKKGYRLKLKFDGYSKIYNFWVNADSMDIFPPGWCAKTNRVLQPPKGMNLLTFNWPTYLTKTKSTPAPRSLFTHLNSSSTKNPFKVGMRLEADDLKNTGKVCVASVADVLDNRVLVHFDGWDDSYDYWIDINSPYIHPMGWHQANGLELIPPPDWEEYFSWPEYIQFTRSESALPEMFSRRYPIEFSTGMKLEVVDVKNPCLIRPATVLCRSDYKILIHLDGWSSELTFWVNDDSPDIHPIGWTDETGHDLEPPPGFDRPPAHMPCPLRGCRGIGNAKRLDIDFHANADTCPYSPRNWEIELEKPSRLEEVGRYVYATDASTSQRKSISEKNTIDISSDDQVTCTDKETDIKPQQPKKQPDSKSLISPPINEANQTVPSVTEGIKLAREYLCDYGPRLKQNYLIWRENSNFNADTIKKNPLEWTTKETADYITAKCHPVGNLFHREDIDGTALLSMQQSDLTDILKIKLGPAIKIYSHILHLRNQVVSRFSDAKLPTDI